ncbi:hypothetical protein B0H10DRAFT_1974394 [Mycena sp. CBHHK59/15]|nr:hypothetical protein B0H10DRAFT_1974394 [Mycena sp. CBHHK59/15]
MSIARFSLNQVAASMLVLSRGTGPTTTAAMKIQSETYMALADSTLRIDRYPGAVPAPPRAYDVIGLGQPPAHGRSTSMTADTPPSPQYRRSRSTYQPPARESHHQPLPPPVSDMQAFFAMLTVQQTQMTELIGQNKQMRDEHQTMQPSGAPSIHGARGLASNRGAFTRSKQRAVRQLHLGLQSPESVDSEDELPPPPSVAASTKMRADKLSISCWSAESASRE